MLLMISLSSLLLEEYKQRDAAEYLEKILCLTSPEASKVKKEKNSIFISNDIFDIILGGLSLFLH